MKPSNASAMPGWVKVTLAVIALTAVAVTVLLATGHGPGRHLAPEPRASSTGAA